MAKQIEGVYEAVLECAKKEFLEKGYKDASLRTIAQEAGTSTSSIYTRFGDKEGLFRAIVEPAAEEMRRMFLEIQENFHQLDDNVQQSEMGQYTSLHQMELLDYIYDHFDEFKLILCRAEGTGYADFIEVLVELEVDRSEEYYALLRKNGMLSGSMTRQLHHMITRAYFTAVCETIVHDMPREEAMKYVDELAIFFHSGWSGLLRLE